ncbi:DMT family transporter [Stappia sp. F7233]|uniref:DMT family transporter n=2 Tax=Stappia albiluteola TaxID=2758565 RepID=A0A839AAM0_9HYPH|nr:DMT family transporter [Stappia albiluteola]
MLSMLVGIVNDTCVKLVASRLPLGEIMFLRGILALALVFAYCMATGAFRHFSGLRHRLVIVRVAAEVGAALLYLPALFRLPLANATAILQSLPLMVTAGAALFLGAPVGWRRWLAIALGFTGVLIIARPGLEGFNIWALVALAGVACAALRDLVTRSLPAGISSFGITVLTLVGICAAGLGLTSVEDWVMPTRRELVLLLAAAVFFNGAFLLMIFAMRTGEIAVVAPFRYSIIVWAIGLGFVVWGEVPDAFTLLGAAVIVATGIYSFLRERKLARRPDLASGPTRILPASGQHQPEA